MYDLFLQGDKQFHGSIKVDLMIRMTCSTFAKLCDVIGPLTATYYPGEPVPTDKPIMGPASFAVLQDMPFLSYLIFEMYYNTDTFNLARTLC